MPSRPADKFREQRLRRHFVRRGLTLAKGYGGQAWFVYDRANLARTATVFYSLDEVEAEVDRNASGPRHDAEGHHSQEG